MPTSIRKDTHKETLSCQDKFLINIKTFHHFPAHCSQGISSWNPFISWEKACVIGKSMLYLMYMTYLMWLIPRKYSIVFVLFHFMRQDIWRWQLYVLFEGCDVPEVSVDTRWNCKSRKYINILLQEPNIMCYVLSFFAMVVMLLIFTYTISQQLINWGRDKMAAFLQMIFSSTFSWMKIFEFWSKFHWSLFTRVRPINNTPALVQIMAWCRSGDKPLSESMVVSLPTRIYVTRPQWVNLAEITLSFYS